MHGKTTRLNMAWGLVPAIIIFAAEPAFAHHVMGGKTPATFWQGLLSGLGHPVIGLDHFAAVIAVGCLAAAHRAAAALAIGFVLAMMAGVALHVQGASVPAAELMVASSVILLGALMLRRRDMPIGAALVLFVLVGLVHGYALGESIYGAERTPLYAYLLGLALIQGVIALSAAAVTRMATQRHAEPGLVRLMGAGIAGVGLAILAQQVIPGA